MKSAGWSMWDSQFSDTRLKTWVNTHTACVYPCFQSGVRELWISHLHACLHAHVPAKQLNHYQSGMKRMATWYVMLAHTTCITELTMCITSYTLENTPYQAIHAVKENIVTAGTCVNVISSQTYPYICKYCTSSVPVKQLHYTIQLKNTPPQDIKGMHKDLLSLIHSICAKDVCVHMSVYDVKCVHHHARNRLCVCYCWSRVVSPETTAAHEHRHYSVEYL